MALAACLSTEACRSVIARSLEGEIRCPDYRGPGGDTMMGDLRHPLILSVRGSSELLRMTLHAVRGDSAPRTLITLPEIDGDYTVTWSQCAGEETERRVADGPDPGWSCGQATEYKRETHSFRKAEPATFVLHVPQPPDAACRGLPAK
jgi:hypothetical protein